MIACPHLEIELPRSIVSSVSRLPIADPLFYKPGLIEVLLGADVFGHLVRPERSIPLTHDLTGFSTVSMSAGGLFVPPMIIFPRKRSHPLLMKGAPPDAIYECHPSGWIQTNLFTKWFQHFIQHVKPTEESPVLLILDGHTSHTRNLELIDLPKKKSRPFTLDSPTFQPQNTTTG